MAASRPLSLFGIISLLCALFALIFFLVFCVSGFLLQEYFEERVLVSVQLISVILVPAFSLFGLLFGIGGMLKDASRGFAKAGTIVNGLLLILECIGFSFLMIVSSSIS